MHDLFRCYADAWGLRDPDAIVALHTEDTRFHAHIDQQPARGKAAVRQAFADLFAQFPDLAFEQVSLRTGSDFWVVEWKMSGTPAGTETRFAIDLIDFITAENGLVKRKDSYSTPCLCRHSSVWRSRNDRLDPDGRQGVRRALRGGWQLGARGADGFFRHFGPRSIPTLC